MFTKTIQVSSVLYLHQIPSFMQYGLVVEEKEVLAVVLSEVGEALTHSVGEVKAILTGTYGKTCQKNFLRQTSTSTSIQRGKNDHRRRYFVFYLKFMPQSMVDWLQRSEWVAAFLHMTSYISYIYILYNIFFSVTSEQEASTDPIQEASMEASMEG